MKRLALISLSLIAAATLAGAGCSTGEDGTEGDAAEVNEGDGDCKIFIVKDQKFVDLKTFLADPSRKNDPVAQKILAPVLQGKACPKTYMEMQKADALQSCSLQTRIVSERSALLKSPDIGRALASRTCGNDPSIFFLIDPIRADKDTIPGDVELLGNNSVDGVFSYYAREPVRGPRDAFDPTDRPKDAAIWKFYGTSVDFVENGYDCDVSKFHGGCQSKFAQDNGVKGNASGARCASCHPGGGMVQKELNSPWSNWMDDPGGYVAKHKDAYGSFQDGDSFESTTTELNKKWAKKRVEVLAKKSVKELLRPVFCTMDINLQSARTSIRADLMIDLAFASKDFFSSPDEFGGIGGTSFGRMDQASYAAAIGELKQTIEADPPFPAGKKFTDTADPFIYPERSNLDHQYIAALVATKKVSEDLIRDILFVDFTRPLYSPTRCSLADSDVWSGITDSTKAKDELIKKLSAKGGKTAAETELLASLQASGAAPRHQAEVDAYLNVCKARATSDNLGMTKDLVRYASHLRQVTKLLKVKLKAEDHELGILDFDETVPTTSLSNGKVVDPRFDPATCKLSP